MIKHIQGNSHEKRLWHAVFHQQQWFLNWSPRNPWIAWELTLERSVKEEKMPLKVYFPTITGLPLPTRAVGLAVHAKQWESSMKLCS